MPTSVKLLAQKTASYKEPSRAFLFSEENSAKFVSMANKISL